MKKLNLIATATMGLESIVAYELKDLGFKNINTLNGKVEYESDLKGVCLSNLWLRCSDRVLIKVGEFDATTFDDLFDKTKELPWGKYIPWKGNFPVAKVASVKSELFAKSTCQSIIKKAVVESLKTHHKTKVLPENGPKFPIRVDIRNNKVTVCLDTSGEGLHKRGYRTGKAKAPLKETMAAALVKLTRWNGTRGPIWDPTCGTGTILIEAAMIAKNIAPGNNRYFISEKWPLIPQKLWVETRDEAYSAERDSVEHRIYGTDVRTRVIKDAIENAKLAGVNDIINFKTKPLGNISSQEEYGTIISNPPYGERLDEEEETMDLYREMGRVFKANFPTWSYYIITPMESFESLFGRKASKKRKLYNGGIKCDYYQFFGPRPPRKDKKD